MMWRLENTLCYRLALDFVHDDRRVLLYASFSCFLDVSDGLFNIFIIDTDSGYAFIEGQRAEKNLLTFPKWRSSAG